MLLAVVTVPQLKVAPALVDEAVMVMLVIAQVSVAGGAILRLGGMIAWLTVVEAELVQPLEGSDTVTE